MIQRKKSRYFYSLFVSLCLFFFFSFPTPAHTEFASAIQYKEEMIRLIGQISTYAKGKNHSFQVIGNNGLDLFRPENVADSSLKDLLHQVDGVLVEGLHYTWEKADDEPDTHTAETSPVTTKFMEDSLALPVASHLPVLIVDYCQEKRQIDYSYQQNRFKGYLSFAGKRELNTIPAYPQTLPGENDREISQLRQVKNFLILLNPGEFNKKEVYLNRLRHTNYDLLIIDRCFNGQPLSAADVTSLKVKRNGASRLVFAYMSIGEAETYRSYWQSAWSTSPPAWMAEENPDWAGSFKVKYWLQEWKQILFGSPEASLDEIVNAGFNGVFMDVIDAYNYFENK